MTERKQYWNMNTQEHLNFLRKETHIKTFISESCVVVSSVYTLDAGFESMVFPAKENGEILDYLDYECKRYDSFKEMQNGHKQLCKKWKKKGCKSCENCIHNGSDNEIGENGDYTDYTCIQCDDFGTKEDPFPNWELADE